MHLALKPSCLWSARKYIASANRKCSYHVVADFVDRSIAVSHNNLITSVRQYTTGTLCMNTTDFMTTFLMRDRLFFQSLSRHFH